MNLSDLRTLLRETLSGVSEITSIHNSQLFGYATRSDQVSYCAIEYSIENSANLTGTSNIAAALIFDNFCNRDLEELGNVDVESNYAEKHRLCIETHKAILKAGYVIKACVNHTHPTGNLVRTEYYRHTGDGWTGSSLRVVYTPSNFVPPEAILVRNKQGEPDSQVYYTPGYEDGQLVYLGCSELDGRNNRSIKINMIDGKVFQGMVLTCAHEARLKGLGVEWVYSVTQSESIDGCKLEYIAKLNCGALVNIVITDYSWSN